LSACRSFSLIYATCSKMWAGAIERAHARSGDVIVISDRMGSRGKFDDAIGEFAVEYADHNQRDYRAFVKAVRAERFRAIIES
jgi:Uncharacterized protein conserved in bacteria (DUF2252)